MKNKILCTPLLTNVEPVAWMCGFRGAALYAACKIFEFKLKSLDVLNNIQTEVESQIKKLQILMHYFFNFFSHTLMYKNSI